MNYFIKIIILVLFFVTPMGITAPPPTPVPITDIEEEFINTQCNVNQTCDLVKMKMRHQNYKLWVIDRFHYGITATFFYETKEISQLENYGFVHFLKGCRYTHSIEKNGTENKLVNFVIQSFNLNTYLKFKDWVVDSPDLDPMASTQTKLTSKRHYFYQWNPTPYSSDSKTSSAYGDDLPVNPVLFVKILPSQSFESDTPMTAYNNSLQGKTCLYKINDIPTFGTRDMNFAAAPIHCFYWNNSALYDFKNMNFEIKPDIDPFCL